MTHTVRGAECWERCGKGARSAGERWEQCGLIGVGARARAQSRRSQDWARARGAAVDESARIMTGQALRSLARAELAHAPGPRPCAARAV